MVQSEKKEKAIKLRLEGKSYGEILKALDIPSKGTLSAWFSNLKLPAGARRQLASKIILARERGLFRFNKQRTKTIIEENKRLAKETALAIPKLTNKDILLVGTSLYWGEGTTREKKQGYQSVSFTNSDPIMIKVFLRYLQELKIDKLKINAGIHIHKNISEEQVRIFWSAITGIAKSKFYIFRSISRASQGKRPKNFLPHGTLNLRINDRRLFYRIKGYIEGITKQILHENPSN